MPNTTTNNASYISTGKPNVTGAVYMAPTTATAPTGVSSTLSSDFKALGYVSDEGMAWSNSVDSENIKAWGGDTVYTVQEGTEDTVKLSFLEALNVDVMKLYYGDDAVSGSLAAGITISASGADLGNHIFVIDTVLADGRAKRCVIPNGRVTEREDLEYVDNDVLKYGVAITCIPDSNGKTHYEYIAATPTP